MIAAENQTDAFIEDLMKTQKAQNDPQKVLEEMERERKEMEDMFTIKAGEVEKLREKDVLSKRPLPYLFCFHSIIPRSFVSPRSSCALSSLLFSRSHAECDAGGDEAGNVADTV